MGDYKLMILIFFANRKGNFEIKYWKECYTQTKYFFYLMTLTSDLKIGFSNTIGVCDTFHGKKAQRKLIIIWKMLYALCEFEPLTLNFWSQNK